MNNTRYSIALHVLATFNLITVFPYRLAISPTAKENITLIVITIVYAKIAEIVILVLSVTN